MEHMPMFGSVDDLLRTVFINYFAGKGVTFYTTFQENMQVPCVIARRDRKSGTLALHSRDERFMQSAIIMVSCITDGPDADQMGEELIEACRYALWEAQQKQVCVPGAGSIAVIQESIHPSRVADWQTSTSVVQYASLPKTASRYEAVFRILVRPPAQDTIQNRFKPQH